MENLTETIRRLIETLATLDTQLRSYISTGDASAMQAQLDTLTQLVNEHATSLEQEAKANNLRSATLAELSQRVAALEAAQVGEVLTRGDVEDTVADTVDGDFIETLILENRSLRDYIRDVASGTSSTSDDDDEHIRELAGEVMEEMLTSLRVVKGD